MSAPVLVLEASRDDRRVKVSVYERSGGADGTLRPYEELVVPWQQVETGVSEITNLLNRANKLGKVSSGNFQSLKKSGQLLFDLLIPPKAAEKLNLSTVTSLVIYIDDKLVQIPWELLFNGREFLCRRFAMGRLVSTSQVPTAASKRTLKLPLKVLLLADPRQDLKASYREGLEIRDLLDRQQKDFEVDFKSAPVDIPFVKKNLRDYDIVHYAGHADYDARNPSDGGWLLSDGRLKASEISAMGGLQPMPSLVFSNACQTGQTAEWKIHDGFEQEIFGLANAYLLAGVQHYIGTFWEILDEPSGYFAKRFYSFLAQGVKVGDAVRRARQELIDAYGEETIVWATYMLYGDPTFEFTTDRTNAVVERAPRVPASVGAPRSIRGDEIAKPQPAPPKSYSPSLYAVLGLVVLALAYGGYSYYSQTDTQISERQPEVRQAQTVTSAPAVTPSPIPLQGTEEKLPPPQKSLPAVADVKKSPEVAKPKELVPTAKAKEAASAPVTKSKEATPPPVKTVESSLAAVKAQETPAPAKTEVAIAKDSLPPAIATPLTLKMNIIGQRKESDGSYTEVLVSEGSVLRSGDNFQVHLEASRAAYVYILMYDSQGRASRIFPDPKIDHPGFVEAGRRVVVPAKDLWFWLDQDTGTETIYVLTAEKPMSEIQGLLAKMEGNDDAGKQRVSQEIKQRIAIVQRGVGGITKGQAVTYTLSDGKKIQKVTDVVTGTGSVVRAVSFLHR
ncbi:MAG: hypothetical protein A3G96_04260 [Gammaproteobacteria bacterium RIFCSPLOWO2_12_FULL_52_10]|nr:MAG: hypothetical protein A3G96_04260 [Gammaproteobacteria bacterium RIFCSPLOWO2_12_FULL_52_10]